MGAKGHFGRETTAHTHEKPPPQEQGRRRRVWGPTETSNAGPGSSHHGAAEQVSLAGGVSGEGQSKGACVRMQWMGITHVVCVCVIACPLCCGGTALVVVVPGSWGVWPVCWVGAAVDGLCVGCLSRMGCVGGRGTSGVVRVQSNVVHLVCVCVCVCVCVLHSLVQNSCWSGSSNGDSSRRARRMGVGVGCRVLQIDVGRAHRAKRVWG